MDDNAIDLKAAINETDEYMEELQEKRRLENLPIIPGEKIKTLVGELAQQEVYSKVNNAKYANELWISLEEFERQIAKEAKGYELAAEFL